MRRQLSYKGYIHCTVQVDCRWRIQNGGACYRTSAPQLLLRTNVTNIECSRTVSCLLSKLASSNLDVVGKHADPITVNDIQLSLWTYQRLDRCKCPHIFSFPLLQPRKTRRGGWTVATFIPDRYFLMAELKRAYRMFIMLCYVAELLGISFVVHIYSAVSLFVKSSASIHHTASKPRRPPNKHGEDSKSTFRHTQCEQWRRKGTENRI
jgi:hypothetical protein